MTTTAVVPGVVRVAALGIARVVDPGVPVRIQGVGPPMETEEGPTGESDLLETNEVIH